ncbi:hypothetical protein [Sphingobacterium sp. CZ-2]|uniref:hypothetical protein n=1 Tax=Sphingobacterium sp. CZ-2 TaxID=2557994 RepID=UPI001ADA2699|nr:hypothetical protein [Sphingobacterium sp. CZ-2]
MKYLRALKLSLIALMLCLSFVSVPTVSSAQCAMCSLNAENSTKDGNTQGKGLNAGILFLLAMPFLFAAGMGILWYKKYRTPSEKSGFKMTEGLEK